VKKSTRRGEPFEISVVLRLIGWSIPWRSTRSWPACDLGTVVGFHVVDADQSGRLNFSRSNDDYFLSSAGQFRTRVVRVGPPTGTRSRKR
jgi:hypothetical protein